MTAKHPYREVATKIIEENLVDVTLAKFMKTYTWDTAREEAARIVDTPAWMRSEGRGKFLALWLWVKASKISQGRITISMHETPICDTQVWQWAAKTVREQWSMYPEVWASCAPYQLVIV